MRPQFALPVSMALLAVACLSPAELDFPADFASGVLASASRDQWVLTAFERSVPPPALVWREDSHLWLLAYEDDLASLALTAGLVPQVAQSQGRGIPRAAQLYEAELNAVGGLSWDPRTELDPALSELKIPGDPPRSLCPEFTSKRLQLEAPLEFIRVMPDGSVLVGLRDIGLFKVRDDQLERVGPSGSFSAAYLGEQLWLGTHTGTISVLDPLTFEVLSSTSSPWGRERQVSAFAGPPERDERQVFVVERDGAVVRPLRLGGYAVVENTDIEAKVWPQLFWLKSDEVISIEESAVIRHIVGAEVQEEPFESVPGASGLATTAVLGSGGEIVVIGTFEASSRYRFERDPVKKEWRRQRRIPDTLGNVQVAIPFGSGFAYASECGWIAFELEDGTACEPNQFVTGRIDHMVAVGSTELWIGSRENATLLHATLRQAR